MEDLGLVVAEIEGHVGEGVLGIPGLVEQVLDDVAQVALVLGLGLKVLGAHLDDLGIGVVARAGKLDELVALNFSEVREIGDAELDDNLALRRVVLAHVGGVSEAERSFAGGRLEGLRIL